MGELAPFEFCNKLFVLLVGELTGVVFEDGLRRFAGGCVKVHDRCHVLAERLCNAGYLLGQDPHGDAVVPGTKPNIDQLARAAFHVLGGSAVVEHKERVGARKEEAGQSQPGLDLMLRAGNHKDVRIAVHEALVGPVLDMAPRVFSLWVGRKDGGTAIVYTYMFMFVLQNTYVYINCV